MLRERSKRATHAEDRMRAASAGPVQVPQDFGQPESTVGRKRNQESTPDSEPPPQLAISGDSYRADERQSRWIRW